MDVRDNPGVQAVAGAGGDAPALWLSPTARPVEAGGQGGEPEEARLPQPNRQQATYHSPVKRPFSATLKPCINFEKCCHQLPAAIARH